jgi:hypothetical protein
MRKSYEPFPEVMKNTFPGGKVPFFSNILLVLPSILQIIDAKILLAFKLLLREHLSKVLIQFPAQILKVVDGIVI